jgi:ABC-2 type transport system permease protein
MGIAPVVRNTEAGPSDLARGRLAGLSSWVDVWLEMSKKELLIMVRYPVEFIASFGQLFLIIAVLVLGGKMFTSATAPATRNAMVAGVAVYGFVLFLFVSDTLWTIGYAIRREQKQGTLEQLYLSPASKLASLVSRITPVVSWTGLLAIVSALLMSLLLGRLPAHNLMTAGYILVASLAGTFGIGFAFAAITLRTKESAQTLANALQFVYMIVCAPFFPFSALPEWALFFTRLIPLAYSTDAFRSTLMGYPTGFPELAPIEAEIAIISIFGLFMPLAGYLWYQAEENRARQNGSLSEY